MPKVITKPLKSSPKSLKLRGNTWKNTIDHLRKRRNLWFKCILLGCAAFVFVSVVAFNYEQIRDKQEAEKIESPKKAPVQLVGRVK